MTWLFHLHRPKGENYRVLNDCPNNNPVQVGIAMLVKNSHTILKIVDAVTNHSPLTGAPIKLLHDMETLLVFVSHLVNLGSSPMWLPF